MPENPQPARDELTPKAADCMGAFITRLVEAQAVLTQFDTEHRTLDGDERVERDRLQVAVDREEAAIQGATILIEHLGVRAPNGSLAWGAHIAIAEQLAREVQGIVDQEA